LLFLGFFGPENAGKKIQEKHKNTKLLFKKKLNWGSVFTFQVPSRYGIHGTWSTSFFGLHRILLLSILVGRTVRIGQVEV
jgi:hypothetical protein